MCMTTVPNPNKIKCPADEYSTMYYSAMDTFQSMISTSEVNCSTNNSYITSVIISELDINNQIHGVKFNITDGFNISDLDVSQLDFPNTIWIVRPAWEVALKTALFLPIIIGGVLSNLILLMIISKMSRTLTPTNILIGSIATVDLITLLICPWMLLIHHFYQNYELGAFGCKFEGFLSGALLITGVMLLSSVSYDRLTVIVLPREARLTRRGAYRLAALSATLGIIFASPLCIYRTYRERQWKNFLETYCSENHQVLPMYWHVLLSTLVWFPITVMTICYSAIFWKLDRYEKQILRREHPLSVSYKMRVARTLFIILLTFIICRIPFTILVFWRNKLIKETQINAVNGSFEILWFIAHYLIYMNCAVNPIIYGLTNENYRRSFGTTPIYKWLNGNKKGNQKRNKLKDANKSYQGINGNKRGLFSCLRSASKKNEFHPEIPAITENNLIDFPEIYCSKITPLTEEYM